ncbi:MAG: alpha/beta hydrolase fold protein [Paucimonas sp.]|nr:alpha/beta hydrolase fold protein [Paucimonas sp.]
MSAPEELFEASPVTGRMEWDLQGEGERCIVFLNGLGMDRLVWHGKWVPAMLEQGFRTLTCNYARLEPGQANNDCQVDDLVEQVRALLVQLRLRNPILVGTSLGAFVAQELAARMPVEALVLLATYLEPGALQNALMQAEWAILAGELPVPVNYMILMDLLQGCTAAQLQDEAQFSRLFTGFARSVDYKDCTRRAHYRASMHYKADRPALANIKAPTLVVGFEQDVLMPPGLCREVAALIPGARYQELRAAGHYACATQAQALVGMMAEFLLGPRNPENA